MSANNLLNCVCRHFHIGKMNGIFCKLEIKPLKLCDPFVLSLYPSACVCFRATFRFTVFNSICRDCNQEMFWFIHLRIKKIAEFPRSSLSPIWTNRVQSSNIERWAKNVDNKSYTDCIQFGHDLFERVREREWKLFSMIQVAVYPVLMHCT